jgi:serine/threonine protein kinase
VEPERFPIWSDCNHVVPKLEAPEDIRAIPTREVNLSPRRSLGKGSFGEVVRGRWRGRDVAVKHVYGDKDVTFDMVSTFMKEVEMLKRCQHQFVVQVLGFSLAPRLMIIMEMCTCSLSDRLHRHSSSPKLLEKLWLLGDAALGVAYLHLQKVVHRDLKPANILLVEEGFDDDCDRIYTAKVADFSLARVKTGGSMTQGTSCGTPHYMAPELLCIKPSFSYKSDVYAFGVIMWETSTGRLPYSEQPDLHVMIASVRNGEREDSEQADIELKYLIESCWDQEPSRRPDFDTIVRTMPGGPSASGSRLPSK